MTAQPQADKDPDEVVQQTLQHMRASTAQLTAADGPFPLAEEDVEHFGTVQKYPCWQRGPNSIVLFTLPELYGDSCTRYMNREFLLHEAERLTYGDTMEAAAALARELFAAYGIRRGQCVAIAGRNHPDWVIATLAVTGFLGAVALPVNSWWVDEELRYGLEDSQTVLLIADLFVIERAPFLEQSGLPVICMRVEGAKAESKVPPKMRTIKDVVATGRGLLPVPPQPVGQEDRAMLMYTSGTTNKPKGVVMSQRSIMTAINMVRLWNYTTEPKEPEVILAGSPLFHVNGSHVAMFTAVCSGAKLVLMYKWDPGMALRLVQAERITRLVGVPTMTYELVQHPDFGKYDTSSLLAVGGGGAAFAAPMINRVNDKFKNARTGTGYGLTETNAVSVFMPGQLFPLRPKSCGLPCAMVSMCIIDEEGKALPPGEVGEICLRGATVMREYWGKPDKTAEVFHFDAEGRLWFKSGDLGALDEDGFVYIMDRAKDIIIRGGENISCGEVEAAVFGHPAVHEVAAVGMPHDRLGEEVAVAVVLEPGSDVGDDELRKHAASRLAAFKVPSQVFRWQGSLPRGATGKIQKREIREQLKARGASKL